jgi:hypothetical protein
MVVYDAFGIAGRAGRIIERNGVPLVIGHRPGKIAVSLRNEILVLDLSQPLARAGIFRSS